VCNARSSKWKELAPFRRQVRALSVVKHHLLLWHWKWCIKIFKWTSSCRQWTNDVNLMDFSLLLSKIQKCHFICFLYSILSSFFSLLFVLFFKSFFINFFFNFVSHNLISFHFYIRFDHHSFNFYLFLFFILFQIEFCFQFHPLVFDFNLFLCQIWSSFFLVLFVLFEILFWLLFFFFQSNFIPYFFVIENFTSLIFRVCLLYSKSQAYDMGHEFWILTWVDFNLFFRLF